MERWLLSFLNVEFIVPYAALVLGKADSFHFVRASLLRDLLQTLKHHTWVGRQIVHFKQFANAQSDLRRWVLLEGSNLAWACVAFDAFEIGGWIPKQCLLQVGGLTLGPVAALLGVEVFEVQSGSVRVDLVRVA